MKVVRTNLSPTMDDFVGRRTQLDAMQRCFSEGARLVTLKGMGGIGKTRLAKRYAHGEVPTLTGGAWFIDLSESTAATGIVQSTAMVLDVPLRGTDLDALKLQLGRSIAGRGDVLMVFDNFEHIVQHAAGTLTRWMEMAPQARFLVTSRERLMVPGEQVVEIPPLEPADAMELFERRSRTVGARWKESDQNRAAIAAIVRQVDALPLAIELAAARSRALSPVQIEKRLSQRFRLLRGGRRGDQGHFSL